MNPEALQAIAAICTILDKIGVWPIGGTFLVIVIGPWVFSLLASRAQEKRFDSMKSMYENNAKLVECYEKFAEGQNDVISLNTAKWATALDKIETNQFCPLNRTKKQRMEDV